MSGSRYDKYVNFQPFVISARAKNDNDMNKNSPKSPSVI